MKYCSILLLMIWESFVFASPRGIAQTLPREALVTLSPTQSSPKSSSSSFEELKKRQTTTQRSTCGYANGDRTKPRTANSGFNCRVDTKNGLWGFCPTTVISASDCGLAGNCVDANACSSGCGILGTTGITTFTCNSPGADFCATALLVNGPDQTYSYIACAPSSGNALLFAEPTITSSAASSSTHTPSSSTPSSTSTTSNFSSSSPIPSSSSSITGSSLSSQSSSAQSHVSNGSSSQSAAPASTTSNSDPSSKNNAGAIVGGVIGGLAVIAFLVLGILFLRKSQRDHVSSEVPTQQNRDDPIILAELEAKRRNSNYQKHGGFGPTRLSTRRDPVELSS